jgi:hypothetical protein
MMHIRAKSAVSNGKSFLAERGSVDGRSRSARRMRDVLLVILAELEARGAVGEGHRALAKSATTLIVFIEGENAKLAAGHLVDIEDLIAATRGLSFIIDRLDLSSVELTSVEVPTGGSALSRQANSNAQTGVPR